MTLRLLCQAIQYTKQIPFYNSTSFSFEVKLNNIICLIIFIILDGKLDLKMTTYNLSNSIYTIVSSLLGKRKWVQTRNKFIEQLD